MESEDDIFGTPDDPENEAEAQAEQDWQVEDVAEPQTPEPMTSDQLDTATDAERDAYYHAGGPEP